MEEGDGCQDGAVIYPPMTGQTQRRPGNWKKRSELTIMSSEGCGRGRRVVRGRHVQVPRLVRATRVPARQRSWGRKQQLSSSENARRECEADGASPGRGGEKLRHEGHCHPDPEMTPLCELRVEYGTRTGKERRMRPGQRGGRGKPARGGVRGQEGGSQTSGMWPRETLRAKSDRGSRAKGQEGGFRGEEGAGRVCVRAGFLL